jgi:hypothetical protein
MDVSSEVVLGPQGMMVYTDSIRSWNPPHQTEVISQTKRDEIIENIRGAFVFDGFAIALQDATSVSAEDIAKSFRSTKPFEIAPADGNDAP